MTALGFRRFYQRLCQRLCRAAFAAFASLVLCLPAAASDSGDLLENSSTNSPAVVSSRINYFREESRERNNFQAALDLAREQRLARALDLAEVSLIRLLESRAPEEIRRPALLELAFVKQEQRDWQKAQRLYAEFVRRFPRDPSVPEVLLRQAAIYRELGVTEMARAKLYAVISTCLNLQLDEIEYYQKLVLQAQQEIADSFFLQGRFADAADFYQRLLRLDASTLDRAEILSRLARSHDRLGAHEESVAAARIFLETQAGSASAPEMRFLLASGLKKLGRNEEALEQILVLLQSQEEQSRDHPELWRYWRQKAGNDIANQLYREGDYLNALRIYEALAGLNESAEWQLPVWYQIGLIYENLKQNPKAAKMYSRIAERGASQAEKSPALQAVLDMAAWRKRTLDWEAQARAINLELQAERERANF